MSRIALTTLAEAMFGCDAEHIPAYVNDDMVAARLLEFLGSPGNPAQPDAPSDTTGGCAAQGQQSTDRREA